MASTAANAPSTPSRPLQFGVPTAASAVRDGIERWLEAERDRLVLWLPVSLGAGIASWYLIDTPRGWIAAMLTLAGVGTAALAVGRHGRAPRAVAIATLTAALGIGLIWMRAERAAAPVLGDTVVARLVAQVTAAQPLPARRLVRLTLRPVRVLPSSCGRQPCPPPPVLPLRLRVNLADDDTPRGLATGSVIALRARLLPPPAPGVPGAYDYAQRAWFDGIGATGRGFAPVVVVVGTAPDQDGIRARLTRHIEAMLPGSEGGIATALVTGDTGAIAADDADAMRRAGLAHLLAISGLHVGAVVTITMLLTLRLLALNPWLALRVRLPLVAAAAGAAAAIGYTLLAGAGVPTVRSCVAALLVLGALMLGREAVTLRLVAAGALVVLLRWPESLAGPSFQLSFAAVAAIVAFHEHAGIRGFATRREEPWWRGRLRALATLVVTGLLVEAALAPIALYHFHREGMYGAFANLIAIPLTTFVVMPLTALALAADAVGAGAPLWWLAGHAIALLLWIAHRTGSAPGAVTLLPEVPAAAFALMIGGGLWLALWQTRVRRLGLLPIALGAAWTLATPGPDLLVTGDGRHVAVRTSGGAVALLRDRAGDYTKAMLSEGSGIDTSALLAIDGLPNARCSPDLCLIDLERHGRTWRVLATRSSYPVPKPDLIAACAGADIVVADRHLPTACRPRWLRLDPATLQRTGGVAVTLSAGRIETVLTPGDRHPWRDPPRTPVSRSGAAGRQGGPARAPGWARNAADHRLGWRDRAGPSPPRDGNI